MNGSPDLLGVVSDFVRRVLDCMVLSDVMRGLHVMRGHVRCMTLMCGGMVSGLGVMRIPTMLTLCVRMMTYCVA